MVDLGDCKKYDKMDVSQRKLNLQICFWICRTKSERWIRNQMNCWIHKQDKWKTFSTQQNTHQSYALQVLYWKLNEHATLLSRRYEVVLGTGYNGVIEWNERAQKKFKPDLEIDLIEKCLWILCKKFNFATTTKVKVDCFMPLRQSLTALLERKLPMLISIESKLATYHHMVAVWKRWLLTMNLWLRNLWQRILWSKFVVLILPLYGLAVGMASFPKQN